MTTMKRIGRNRILALAVSFGLLAGCKDAVGSQEPDVLAGLDPGIHPVMVVASQSGNTATLELHLKRVKVDASIASFQGELSYDASAMKLTGAELPQGIMGSWNETAPGTVRFAGAALEGIGDRAVLVLRFTGKGVRAESFRVMMEEIVSAAGFENLASSLVARDQPIFSPGPLK